MRISDLIEHSLVESPIGDISHVGSQEPASFRDSDLRIIRSEKGQAKIRRVLDRAPIWIDLIFFNHDMKYSSDFSQATDPKAVERTIDRMGMRGNPFFAKPQAVQLFIMNNDLKSIQQRLIDDKRILQPQTSWIVSNAAGEQTGAFSRQPQHLEPGQTVRELVPNRQKIAAYKRQLTNRETLKKQLEQAYNVWSEMTTDSSILNKIAYPSSWKDGSGGEKADQMTTMGFKSRARLFQETGIRVEPSDHLTYVVGFNEGDDRYPLTGWMIAHRLGHAIGNLIGNPIQIALSEFTRGINDFVKDDHDRMGEAPTGTTSMANFSDILHQIGTFKSARNGEIGSLGEFVLDCFAQFLVTGTVRFNPVPEQFMSRMFVRDRRRMIDRKTPMGINDGKNVFLRETEQLNAELEKWRNNFVNNCTAYMETLKGKIAFF